MFNIMAIQVLLNLTVIGVLFSIGFYYFKRRERDRLDTVLVNWKKESRDAFEECRGQIREKLKNLNKICDEATRLIRVEKELSSQSSVEAEEFKILNANLPEASPLCSLQNSPEEIPTIGLLRKTQEKLDTDLKLNLRTLLKDSTI